MIKQKKYCLTLIVIFLTLITNAQSLVNQYDEAGKRDGLWSKNFDNTTQPRYEGEFDHGKEIGLFKFYTLKQGKSVLSATKQFNKNNDNADVTFFSSKGKKISEGQMDGKLYVGKWLFYHNKVDAVMSEDFYNDEGQLEGKKTIFYPIGKIAETSHYKAGKLNGVTEVYAETGVLLKQYTYQNDELHGAAKYYDANGKIAAEGVYQHDRKHGIWTYYLDGELEKTIDHTRRSQNPKQ
ncbi:toxin-antitoxin system YwqK family antitoxin [Subsaximicrobium wynnwilliamsii]|uniref:Toxin-antitoxin system YwqK family antitoxin n=1 Tax=Subsaximicrobium wynnwilliamsii TaxID=291179 RepID=A0A5C6ZHU6_9FLAO|nr:toxin-antitoxin system YwqK family antitoxin [Subsaximicrobium wynnwilliamsii]TXD88502.1 toxin-antitoxin system YwqK family antitoxin [Subsaximicrobium wynnwilliamsii]TXE02502.1 toxin-antitoxin system YwqK family antitoxin [Subsaximicrobium wynnwilliamsii]